MKKTPQTELKLTLKQKLFCDFYLSFWEDTFWNATKSYAKAYNYDLTDDKDSIVAKQWGYENLTKPYIKDYIRKKLETVWFNDDIVDTQTAWLINHWSRQARKAGIEIYNKLKKRGADNEEVVKPIKIIFRKE